ncbi:MAG: 5-(carboxyamino)imidazole ribonucleotide mutase [Bacteroidota bacterium]
MSTPLVSIIMGSDSDLEVMRNAADILEGFDIPFELTIVSAHRTPERLFSFAQSAHTRGIRVVIAGAGGAAHLPGMVASLSPLPVIGVPIHSSNSIDGWDSVLSILQMPGGVPVATVALDGAKNAGILAAQIIGSSDQSVQNKVAAYKKELAQGVAQKYEKLERIGYKDYKKE